MRLRSVLYLPASNERALAKVATLACDAVIYDLEDAVAPDQKEVARDRAVAAVAGEAAGAGPPGPGRTVTIRCNAIDSPWGAADLEAVARVRPDAVVLPKVAGPADVDRCAAVLAGAGAPQDLALWAMIETPAGVLRAAAIAAHPRVEALVMGTNDLLLELRAAAVPGRSPLVPHLAAVVLAARAAGVAVLDGVHNDIDDADGFVAECRQGAELGFDGKTLIHPRQIEPCNEAWTPAAEAVDHAERVIAAHAAALAQGRGVATVDGRLVEHLHVEMARRIIEAAGPS